MPTSFAVVILFKTHLTLHSRMSGSRWVTTPSQLSRSLRPFLYSSSMYSCHLFLISSASARSIPFLPFIVPILARNDPSMSLSNYLEEISSHSHCIAFLYYLHCSFKKAFLSLLAILWNSAFICFYLSFSPLPFSSLLFLALCKASSDNHLPSCISFSLGWLWSLPPVQCCCCCFSVAQWCPTVCDPMDCSMLGFPVLHHLLEFTQTHIHWVGDAIQPSHLLIPSPPAFDLSQHQGLFQWVSSLHQVAKVLKLEPQHQSFQWISVLISFRID